MVSIFLENARRSVDMVHRFIFFWGALAIFYIFTRGLEKVSIDTAYLKIVLPKNLSAFLLLGAIWLLPLILRSFVNNLSRVAWHIKQQGEIDLLLTYPCLPTSGRSVRIWCGVFLSWFQATLGVNAYAARMQLDTYFQLVGLGAFMWFYAFPMLMFAWSLANWDAQVTGRRIFANEPVSEEKP